MGGFGSGRTAYATTPDDCDCAKLDANEFTEALGSTGLASGTSTWSTDGGTVAEIGWNTTSDPTDDAKPDGLHLVYLTSADGEDRDHDYTIRVTRTECNFGGERPWWICPECSDRVGKLYLPLFRSPSTTFACRDCQDVAYTSSRASGNTDRTLRMRYNRIRKKLGADPAHPNTMGADVPDRPKGMHQDTYDKFVDELEEARREWQQEYFIVGLEKYAPDDYGVV